MSAPTPAPAPGDTELIDTHLHLWQLSRPWYAWNTPELGPVHADSRLGEVSAAMDAVGVAGAVVVQAADRLEETAWLLRCAARAARIRGVVGYLPLTDLRRLRGLLDDHAGSALVGVRQLWHDHDDPEELARRDVRAGLELLGASGLVIDVPDAHPALWPALARVVEETPGTTFVLDHVGKPPFGDAGTWSRWEADFVALAQRPNVIVKLSGLFGGSGSAAPATAAELARLVELTRAAAGADRTMIGSDWPMVRGRLSYEQTLTSVLDLLADWTPAERSAATAGTARRIYGLS
jgi:L-fuconolactonase